MKNKKAWMMIFITLCFVTMYTTFAAAEFSASEPSQEIIAKQAEIDQFLFEEYVQELAEKGIMVTHTAPLEQSVEIGITPFNDENANYIKELIGVDQVTIVEGQQATTLSKTSEEAAQTVMPEEDSTDTKAEKNSGMSTNIYIAAGAIVLLAGVMIFIKRRKA
ncbi:LPXTG cell wall anchor domain-containing protein [Bacillus marasmi]|uniref:LPXTG cell wall anchor domain-containing protein n=1 Tax=Bacillus marasmi TaxID=1926279 RepID=UPI00164D97DB|nr:LPXTG cell wall anchor domain-containing protein [Bacillus marasmi]